MQDNNVSEVESSDVEEEKDFSEMLDEYQNKKRFFNFEGDSGMARLNEIFETLGYGHNYRYGSPLEAFLSDNSGACEAMLEWLAATGDHIPEWKESLQGALDDLAEDEKELEEDND